MNISIEIDDNALRTAVQKGVEEMSSETLGELVKRLRDREHEIDCSLCDRDCCYPDGKVHGKCIIIEAADAIEELSRQKEYWISVYDRFPPAEKEVYVTDGEYIARANLLDEVFPGDKPCWSYSGLGEITHWCEQIPLPLPSKEE